MNETRAAAGGPGWTARLLVASAVLVFAGCASHTPEPLEPAAVLAELRQRAEEPVRLGHDGPGSAEWFPLQAEVRLDDGLTLGEANALALFCSPRVRVARAEARVAGAQVLQAGVLANPELFLGPRISTLDSGLIFPASLSWELPLWGRRGAERELAHARSSEHELEVIEVEVETLLEIRESFLRLGRLRREESLLAAAAAANAQIVAWVEGLRESGEVDAAAVFLARTERDEADVALESLRARSGRTRRELFSILGLLPDAPVEPIVDESAEGLPPLVESEEETLLRVPAVRAAAAAYLTAEAALDLEVRKQFPDIRIGPEFEDDRGESSYGINLGATLPVFDRNQGGIAAAVEARRTAGERYRAALLVAAHADARARDDLRISERLLERHRDGALRGAAEASRSLEMRLRTGRADVVEVLSAQRAVARARAREVELTERIAAEKLRAAVASGLALLSVPPVDAKEAEE